MFFPLEFLGSKEVVHPVPLAIACFIISTITIQLLALRKAIRSPLSKIPGPWYAPLTTVHLQYAFATGEIWKTAEKCHQDYGNIVRIGPRQIWIADKIAMKQILQTVDLPKVSMYAEISRDRFSPGLFGEM
jgi:hypothetical protein